MIIKERWSPNWRPLDHSPAAVAWERRALGWSQQRLATEVGVGRSFINELESGARNANPAMIVRLARALGCPAGRLRRSAA